jgi:hypothetical protein
VRSWRVHCRDPGDGVTQFCAVKNTGLFHRRAQSALKRFLRWFPTPPDWLGVTTPRKWRLGAEKVSYRWEEPAGANPLRV